MDEIVKQNLFEVSPNIMQQYNTLFILIFADMTANIPTKEVEIL
jgi:dipeptide/tripeptide permease